MQFFQVLVQTLPQLDLEHAESASVIVLSFGKGVRKLADAQRDRGRQCRVTATQHFRQRHLQLLRQQIVQGHVRGGTGGGVFRQAIRHLMQKPRQVPDVLSDQKLQRFQGRGAGVVAFSRDALAGRGRSQPGQTAIGLHFQKMQGGSVFGAVCDGEGQPQGDGFLKGVAGSDFHEFGKTREWWPSAGIILRPSRAQVNPES